MEQNSNKYKIVDIHPEDTYYENKEALLGILVEEDEEFFVRLHASNPEFFEAGWQAGWLSYIGEKEIQLTESVIGKGQMFYFAGVKLEKID